MSKQKAVVSTTISSVLALGMGLASQSATAAVPDAPANWEKCAGIVKAGKNDCGSMDGKHSCANQSTIDNSDQEWVYVPEGTCTKITGGQVVATKPAKAAEEVKTEAK